MDSVSLITGAAGGIGRATVEVFAEAGWQVVAIDRRKARDLPHGVTYRMADVSQEDQVAALGEWMQRDFGRLDALVNNAAVQICKPLTETTLEEWDTLMGSNLRSIFLTVKAMHPLLVAAQGAIVNISSVHAIATSRNLAAYAASKGAVVALTRALAVEFGGDDIRVNAVLPGATDTEMLRSGLDRGHLTYGTGIEAQLEELASKTVIPRVADPHEIARSILFLADREQASFITGQALIVDGGATARLSTE